MDLWTNGLCRDACLNAWLLVINDVQQILAGCGPPQRADFSVYCTQKESHNRGFPKVFISI